MSWSGREMDERRRGNELVRRVSGLPRSLLGGFSRFTGRRNTAHNQTLEELTPADPGFHHRNLPSTISDEFAFVSAFENRYGPAHPFFYACKFVDALKIARDEKKFVFLFLHSSNHPFSGSFCRETLCSELVTQFLDRNFVSWGALVDRGEGLQMAAALKPASFPYCAVVAAGTSDRFTILQQMEGPMSPAQLVEILQRTMEEQGSAFSGMKKLVEQEKKKVLKAKDDEKIRENPRLREEQDAAYLAAPRADEEKERNLRIDQKPSTWSGASNHQNPRSSLIAQTHSGKKSQTLAIREPRKSEPAKSATQILIRFPNGERREKSFSITDRIWDIYSFIESSGLSGYKNYRLVSAFPRRVYDIDQMGTSLKDAGLYPRASLFVELLR